MSPAPKKKVAVLGGGVGALCAAYGILQKPGALQEYEITVYQLGWRLGGKGASGRNPDYGQRIEEHGLHVWAGFYDNAFRAMQECYGWLGAQPWYASPFRTWQDAFQPQSNVSFEEHVDGKWLTWHLDIPTNDKTPGDHSVLPSLWEFVIILLEWLEKVFRESHHPHAAIAPGDGLHPDTDDWVHDMVRGVRRDLGRAEDALDGLEANWLHAAVVVARALNSDVMSHKLVQHSGVLYLLRKFLDWIHRTLGPEIDSHTESRRLWMMLDFGVATVTGLIKDGVLFHGFNVINDIEWSAWMTRHGVTPITLESPFVRGTYDYVFGYRGGRTDRADIEAGTCVHGLYRLVCTYKGALFYKMQAGMGDTVFTPLYLYLKHHGVKFEFFHRVKQLHLGEDGASIGGISLGRQVTLEVDEYDPLVTVNELGCWPAEPRYYTESNGTRVRQIREAEQLQRDHIDLESAWTPWKDVGEVDLVRGRDFDDVVLGISLGGLPDVAGELIAASDRWRAMTGKVLTVQTQAMQLWLKPDATGLGMQHPGVILTAYAQPMNTYADMSELLPREDWPAGADPKSIAYFCGPLPDADPIPPHSDHGFPAREADRVHANSLAWIPRYAGHVWPKASSPDDPAGLRWDLLVDPKDRAGTKRFDGQYWRANIDPSQRYVLSVTDSSRHRLPADDPDFANLYLAGDWVATSLNAGCVEAACMAGLAAARAVTGSDLSIHGEHSDRGEG